MGSFGCFKLISIQKTQDKLVEEKSGWSYLKIPPLPQEGGVGHGKVILWKCSCACPAMVNPWVSVVGHRTRILS